MVETGTFGERLRRRREAAGLSQEELAERAGLTANAISALERGERKRPYPDTLRRLADALRLGEEERAELAASVSRTRGGQVSSPAPGPAVSPRVTAALPGEPTPLVGREREAEVVLHLLSRPQVRLLTLTGPGGVGKTRLALRVAGEAGNCYPDGVVWVPLAPLRDAELVLPAIAQSLGLAEAAGRDLGEALRSSLRDRQALLVLDNFEHVLGAARDVAGLLLSCPGLDVLATSRAPLGVRGEQEYPVPPLELPPSTGVRTPRDVEEVASVRLFVRRAQAALPSFQLTPGNATAVAAICRRLDGLPLALELAAARVKLLEPAELSGRLDRALPLLTGGARDLPERQRTMRGAIGWSYGLLGDAERVLFGTLSVFQGGWDLGAAEAVGANGSAEVLDSLSGLVDQSLVVVERRERVRYRMLEPVRQYAAEILGESGEEERTSRRHAEHYLALAEKARPQLRGADQGTWFERLEEEHGNLRAALGWSLEVGESGIALRLGAALWWFWYKRGHLDEGRQWLAKILEADSGSASPARAAALKGAGVLAQNQADYYHAEELYEQSLALNRELGDRGGVADGLHNLGTVAQARGEYALARAYYEESLSLRRELNDAWGQSLALNALGVAARSQGDAEAAASLCEESLARFRQLGDTAGVAMALSNLAGVALDQGRHDAATALCEESLALYRRVGERKCVALLLSMLGDTLLPRGKHGQAAERYAEALAQYREIGDKAGIALCLDGLAETAGLDGGSERAARLFGAAAALREAIGAPMPAEKRDGYERRTVPARAALGGEAFAVAFEEGRAMGLDRAVEYGLLASELSDITSRL